MSSGEKVVQWFAKWGIVILVVLGILYLLFDVYEAFGWSWTVAGFVAIAFLGFILGYVARYWTVPAPPPSPESKLEPKSAVSTQAKQEPKRQPEPELEPRGEPGRKPLPLPTPPEDREKKPPSQAKRSSPEVYKALRNAMRDRAVCPKGPHIVKAGKALPIELDIEPGDHVMGALREVSGSRIWFDFYICDHKGKLQFDGGIKPTTLDWGYDDHTHSVDFKVPSTLSGPLYLILSVETKQLPRKIEAVLEWVDD